jgi:DNA-binding CsgD family transcriptional regulator
MGRRDATEARQPFALDPTGGITPTSVFDAIPAPALILDADGVIVAVNHAWRSAAAASGLADPAHGVGTDYLALCRATRDDGADHAHVIADGLESVLAGAVGTFKHIYPCPDAAGNPGWAEVLAGAMTHETGVVGILMQHLDLTRRDSASLRALTKRERVVLAWVVEGLSNKAIARHENITESAVKFHLHKIYPKLGVTNRAQAAQVGAHLMIAGSGPAPTV